MHSTLRHKPNKKTCSVNLQRLPASMAEICAIRRSSRISRNLNASGTTMSTESVVPKKLLASKKKQKSSVRQLKSLVDPLKSVYMVEEIRSVYVSGSSLTFEVKWKHWDETHNSIEPLHNLNCPGLLKQFVQVENGKYEIELKELSDSLAVGQAFTDEILQTMIPTENAAFDEDILQCYLLALLDVPRKKHNPALLQKVKELLQRKVFLKKRQTQKLALLKWEKEMNEVDFKGKLRVVNDVDFEGPPAHFTYIDKNIMVDNIYVDDPPLSCTCEQCSYKSDCCGKLNGSEFAYTISHRLKHTGVYLYECNKRCKCGPDCNNRVVQRGRTNKLCLFKTSNGRGWGVQTDRPIKSGEFVCEYMGEVIKSDVAEQRGLQYDKAGATYLFDLDHLIKWSEPYTIDAYKYGNVAHFINHSCEPNLCVVSVWVDCLHPNLSRLALFASEDIEKGHELTIDYKFSYNLGNDDENVAPNEQVLLNSYGYPPNNCPRSSEAGLSSAGYAATGPHVPKYMDCLCGTKTCRKVIQYC